MTGLDCNILVQLAMDDHAAHAATFRAVESKIARGNRLALVSLVVTEFLHVVTDPRRFAPPLTISDALDWTGEFRRNNPIDSIEPNPASLDQTLRWMRDFKLGRKRVLDTHLADTLYSHGITRLLTSNPGDFAIFRVIETVTP
jgi:toxin-antitoxin system PIN domain toxin